MPEGAARPVHRVVALAVDPEAEPAETVLFEGRDFYGGAVVNRSGDRVAVVAWDHPDMPWDAGELLVRAVDPGSMAPMGEPLVVAGGPGESVGQPAWQADGRLRFVSDRRGWWQPYVADLATGGALAGTARRPRRQSSTGPTGCSGQATMAELPDGTPRPAADRGGPRRPGRRWTRRPGRTEAAPQPCVAIGAVCAHGEGVALIGATPEAPPAVWVWRPGGGAAPAAQAAG